MKEQDYLPCSGYEGKKGDPNHPGYVTFFDSGTQQYYFAAVDSDGKPLLVSEGYPKEETRDNGLRSVKENRPNNERWKLANEGGSWFWSLRAGNNQEIARSCPYSSEAAANGDKDYLTGAKQRMAAKASSGNHDDNYLACSEYAGHKDASNHEGLVRFTHANGEHYFAWYGDGGKVWMRSEGYPTTAARDNGLESVAKNRDMEERYSILPKAGKYFVILKAGNHQEIGRSCPFDSEEDAKSIFPSERAKRKAAAAAPVAASRGEEDDYLVCKEYLGHPITEQDAPSMAKFTHANGKHYFVCYNADGTVCLRSEGYPTTAARDNGYESVVKNREIPERYYNQEAHGAYFTILKAGNNQEIARSCPRDSKDMVMWKKPVAAPPPPPPVVQAPPPPPPPVVQAPPPPPPPVHKEKEDDYLICDAYKGHPVNDKTNNIAYFKYTNGQYYFVAYHGDGSVKWRSEGFETITARDSELMAVIKHMNDNNLITTVEKGGYKMRILKDTSGREIGRSCPEKIAVAPPPPPPPPPPPVQQAPSVAPVKQSAPPPQVHKEKEDDYLACDEYKGHPVNDKKNNIAFFKHKNGQYYFAAYHANGSVKWRSEGFETANARDQEVAGVIKYMDDNAMINTVEKGGYKMRILKDKSGREVGRSCPEKIVVAAPPPPPVVKPVAPPPPPPPPAPKVTPIIPPVPVPAVETPKGKFPYWLLAVAGALLLFWWLWRGCKPQEVPPPPALEAPAPPPPPVEEVKSQLEWIFFDFDKADLRTASMAELDTMAMLLTSHADWTGLLRGHTDAKGSNDYNRALSQRRVDNAKAYLVSKGIDAARITTEISGEEEPIAKNEKGNADTEEGRQFNRRVELYVKGGDSGAKVEEIKPSIPDDLKN